MFFFRGPKKTAAFSARFGGDAGYRLEVERTGKIFGELVLLSFCGLAVRRSATRGTGHGRHWVSAQFASINLSANLTYPCIARR